VKPDALQAAHAERSQAVVVFQYLLVPVALPGLPLIAVGTYLLLLPFDFMKPRWTRQPGR
jgi:hypothetical protein